MKKMKQHLKHFLEVVQWPQPLRICPELIDPWQGIDCPIPQWPSAHRFRTDTRAIALLTQYESMVIVFVECYESKNCWWLYHYYVNVLVKMEMIGTYIHGTEQEVLDKLPIYLAEEVL